MITRDQKSIIAQKSNDAFELGKLIHDEDSIIRYFVANNPATSQRCLKIMAFDKNWRVRFMAFKNKNTEKDVVDYLEKDEELRINILRNNLRNYEPQK